ncbi:MAG TPA: 3-deoxy-D-manno-octulosonic acid transferase [Nitrospirae bacterium]|nr:3-deoxy-D-manno-octulosonic acid transferase [Nitrospirota bacterium]
MIHFVYSAALYLALPLLSFALVWKMAAQGRGGEGFFQKLGFFLPRQTNPVIWIHAVSVGEAMAAIGLAKEIVSSAPGMRVMFSTTTPTGQAVAQKELSPDVNVFYFPYDFPGSAKRAIRAVNPKVLALVDTEMWPNIIRACVNNGGKVALINGRVSDRSFPRYRRFSWIFRFVLKNISLFLMQSEIDGERIVEMGADPVRVEIAGNIKFDRLSGNISEDERARLRRSLGIGPNEKVLFLGSVHKGEEAAIGAVLKVRESRPELRLVIAPRRIDDIEWIKSALDGSGLEPVRKSGMGQAKTEQDKNIVPVIDTFGELAKLYSVADIAFVGGSFIKHGGQNPLEPAAIGVPVLFGPHMSNFREASLALVTAGGAFTVDDEKEMAVKLETLLANDGLRMAAGKAALDVVEKNRGATKKTALRIVALAND